MGWRKEGVKDGKWRQKFDPLKLRLFGTGHRNAGKRGRKVVDSRTLRPVPTPRVCVLVFVMLFAVSKIRERRDLCSRLAMPGDEGVHGHRVPDIAFSMHEHHCVLLILIFFRLNKLWISFFPSEGRGGKKSERGMCVYVCVTRGSQRILQTWHKNRKSGKEHQPQVYVTECTLTHSLVPPLDTFVCLFLLSPASE